MLHLISEHKSKNVLFQCLLGKSNLQVLKWKGGNLRVRGDDVKRFFGNWFESEPFLAKTFLPRAGKVAIRCTEMPRSGSYNSRIGWLKIQIFSGFLLLIFWFVNLNWNVFSYCFEGKFCFHPQNMMYSLCEIRPHSTHHRLFVAQCRVSFSGNKNQVWSPPPGWSSPTVQCKTLHKNHHCCADMISANFWRTNVIFV